MDELEQLIAEQAQELRSEQRQRPQLRTQSLDAMPFQLDSKGKVHGRDERVTWDCAIHGKRYLKLGSPSSWYAMYCGECHREYDREAHKRRRRENRERQLRLARQPGGLGEVG